MDDKDTVVVQQQATVGDIIDAHMHGMGGYAIAEKFGIDTEKVKQIIHDADVAGKFIPKGAAVPVDKVEDVPAPIEEGVNPEVAVETTDTVKE